jgi:hypothetical protein
MVGVLILALAAGFYLMLSAGAPAHAQEVNCGDTITEEVVLQRDLDCELGAGEHGLTVQGPATLDLGGFNVSCEGNGGDSCVVLVGAGARLQSGGVHTGRRDGLFPDPASSPTPAVRVAGAGGHTVEGIDAFAGYEAVASTCFVVESDGNRLQDNRAFGRQSFYVEGNDNFLTENTSLQSSDFAVEIRGANNHLLQNTLISGESTAILVDGPNNVIIGNQIAASPPVGAAGIFLREGADFTTVLGNTLTDSDEGDRKGYELAGINVSSDHNLITSNSVQELGAPSGLDHGIALREGATGNVVLGNRVTGAVTDLVDENRGCDDNVWLANVFETVNRPCVALRLRGHARPSRP